MCRKCAAVARQIYGEYGATSREMRGDCAADAQCGASPRRMCSGYSVIADLLPLFSSLKTLFFCRSPFPRLLSLRFPTMNICLFPSLFSIVYIHRDSLQYMLKYDNLSSWVYSSTDLAVEALNFKILKEIVYRESLLVQLEQVCRKLDNRYWNYAVLRIKACSENKSLNTDLLVSKKNRIFVILNEISTIIAHLRSIGLEIVDSIIQLRIYVRKSYDSEHSLSVYWYNENYFLKVSN
jgi:hypothetical protein